MYIFAKHKYDFFKWTPIRLWQTKRWWTSMGIHSEKRNVFNWHSI